jgi:hypothetical protein
VPSGSGVAAAALPLAGATVAPVMPALVVGLALAGGLAGVFATAAAEAGTGLVGLAVPVASALAEFNARQDTDIVIANDKERHKFMLQIPFPLPTDIMM